MILSVLWTEIICLQAQTKICQHTLILLLRYLAKKQTAVYETIEPFGFYCINFQQSKIDNI